MIQLEEALAGFPRVSLGLDDTAIERMPRLGAKLGIDLYVKRDDGTQLAFGGNKSRQLEYYFGQAVSGGADTVLITGAVQSNYVRMAAAAAAKLGLSAVVQLENRVGGMGSHYHSSGNVLLDRIFGAEILSYPSGDDEEGADDALRRHAERLQASGRRCYVIPLAPSSPPLGALGYVRVALQILRSGLEFDAVVVASGSGLTHAGLVVGACAGGLKARVLGICVRRDAQLQRSRVELHCEGICELLRISPPRRLRQNIFLYDGVLAPGYGIMNPSGFKALLLAARLEGMILDPVYTAKAMAGLIHLAEAGDVSNGQRVLFIHTGGAPAIYGYANEILAALSGARDELTVPLSHREPEEGHTS